MTVCQFPKKAVSLTSFHSYDHSEKSTTQVATASSARVPKCDTWSRVEPSPRPKPSLVNPQPEAKQSQLTYRTMSKKHRWCCKPLRFSGFFFYIYIASLWQELANNIVLKSRYFAILHNCIYLHFRNTYYEHLI